MQCSCFTKYNSSWGERSTPVRGYSLIVFPGTSQRNMLGRWGCSQTLHKSGQLGQGVLKGCWQDSMSKQDTQALRWVVLHAPKMDIQKDKSSMWPHFCTGQFREPNYDKTTLNLLCWGCHQLLWEHFPGVISLSGFSPLSGDLHIPAPVTQASLKGRTFEDPRVIGASWIFSLVCHRRCNSQTMYIIIIIIEVAQFVIFQLIFPFYCMSFEMGCIAGLLIREGQ